MGKTAGVDEAGRGPWAGPVVAACVILKDDIRIFDEIKDSKQLSEKRREEFYDLIKQNSVYGIGVASNREIDRLGIVKATELAIKRALDHMPEKPSFLLIDGKDSFDLPIKYKTIVNGDQKVKSISAASILAKVWRDRYMRLVSDMYPLYGFEKHKGYGTKLHLENLKAYGPCEIHRFSFKPIKEVQNGRLKKPRLLLHTCCAPCATSVIERLKERYELEVFFYNPNIHPKSEYSVRLEEIKRLCKYHGLKLTVGGYDIDRWFRMVKVFKGELEGGKRCTVCYAVRMKETAKLAYNRGFDYFTTTLSVSPLKDYERIGRIGVSLSSKYGVKFENTDFKKKDGFKRSVELSKEFGFYRQDYCGCVYSNLEVRRKRKKDGRASN